MKPEERLLELIGNIPDEMLDEALKIKRAGGSGKKRWLYGIAAAACIIVLFIRFVPAGQVMAAQLKEQAERLLEELFPPKDISLRLEGMEEEVPHEAYGELPKETEGFSEDTEKVSGQSADQAGFAIYVDSDSFEMTEEEDCHVIRGKRIVYTREDAIRDNTALLAGLTQEEKEQKIREIVEERQAFYDSFPTGEIRITQEQEVSVEEAAGEMREELLKRYAEVSEIMVSELPKGLYLRAEEGTAWDCEVKEVYFVDDGLGGVFVITASYIVEAEEGTGARFRSMIETFEVLEPSDSMQIERITNRFAKAYFEGDVDTLKQYLTKPYVRKVEVCQNADNAEKIAILAIKGLADIGEKEIGDVCVISVEYQESEITDAYRYLTIEFVKEDAGWKIRFYGIEG